jgi:hypothetical protein
MEKAIILGRKGGNGNLKQLQPQRCKAVCAIEDLVDRLNARMTIPRLYRYAEVKSGHERLKLRNNLVENIFVCLKKPRFDYRSLGRTFVAECYVKREIGIETHFLIHGDAGCGYFVAITESATTDYFEMQRLLGSNDGGRPWNGTGKKDRRSMLVLVL